MAKVQFGFASANSLNSKQVLPLLLAGILALGTGVYGHRYIVSMPADGPQPEIQAPLIAQVAKDVSAEIRQAIPAEAAQVVDQVAAAVAPEPEHFERQVELGRGEIFSNVLADADVSEDDTVAVVKAINVVYQNKKLPVGQEFTLSFTRRGTDESLDSVTFQPEPTKEVSVQRQADGSFVGRVLATPLERQRIAARVDIRSTLNEAGKRASIPSNIMAALVRVYTHTVDFQREIRPGDKFEVLYDQPMGKNGKPVGDGTIIYAALEIGGKIKPLYRVTFGDGTVDYFNAEGQSLKRAILRTPVDGAHMTSGFGMRLHPLLGYSKMHKGVDFGAPTGTPILAAGSGTVVEIGFNGSYGRYIRLRHNGRTETAYAHMSRFARTLYRGAQVNQGDVIGFVGTSGRSTGPHLHFEVMIDGDQVNPLNVKTPMGRVLEGQALNQFRQGEHRIRQEFLDLLSKRTNATASIAPVAPAATPVAQVKTASATPRS